MLTRCSHLKEILHTRSYQSVECDTDHSLVGCKVKICVKKIYCNKNPSRRHLNISNVKDYQSCTTFNNEINKLRVDLASANEAWCGLRLV